MGAPERQSVIDASNAIEEMAAELKRIVIELRADPENQGEAYLRLYDFRTRFGYVLRTLGLGAPRARHDVRPEDPMRRVR